MILALDGFQGHGVKDNLGDATLPAKLVGRREGLRESEGDALA
jgi:hypothetical protein